MKKNNRGFTLVELLAALVVLSIMAVLALPTVINLMGNSKDKLYISDAKKLISQAEYKFRAASSELEKPDDGECLILSMVYLDNADFDSPPNGGKYVREASFVVVKNNNGNFEFSVELVEEVKKGSYKGVALSKDSELKTSSTRQVVNFDKEELHFVENNTTMGSYNGKYLDSSYINSQLGSSYVSVISKVYNYPDLADSTYNANYSFPKISRVEYVSASNKPFNTLDAILKLVVNDADTKSENLLVYVGPGSDGRYPNLNVDFCDASMPYDFRPCKYQYGTSSDFSLKVDFSKIGMKYDGSSSSLYVIVVDPEGNSDRINPTYKVHTNEEPVIDKNASGLSKDKNIGYNSATATLKLVVEDDTTPLNELEYCLVEWPKDGPEPDSCPGGQFKKYSDFKDSELSYTFKCGGECAYDGSKVKLKVFIRDTSPEKLQVSESFEYTLYENQAPVVETFTLESEKLSFVVESSDKNKASLALTATVKLEVDDVTDDKQLSVVLAEDEAFTQNVKELKYSDFKNVVKYTFTGNYDGTMKKLYLKVTDEFGVVTTDSRDYGKIHNNEVPSIGEVVITSKDLVTNVCPETGLCDKYSDNGGAYEVDVEVTAYDDLVAQENLKVCISKNQGDCTDASSANFKTYAEGRKKSLTLDYSGTGNKFDGQTIPVYVAVYDGYAIDSNLDLYTDETVHNYNIYKNQKPEIDDSEIIMKPESDDYNSLKMTLSFRTQDDLDSVNTLKFSLREKLSDPIEKINITATSFDEFISIEHTFDGGYDGVARPLILEVYDTYGNVTRKNLSYTVHKNNAPTINYVTVESNGNPCTAEECIGGNSINAKVRLSVVDDLDVNTDNLLVCINQSSSSSSCTNYVALKNYTGMEKNEDIYILPYTISAGTLPYKGSTYNVYVHVKDSIGSIAKDRGSYTLYDNRKAQIVNGYPIVESSNGSDTIKLSEIKFKLNATDDFNSNLKYNICYTTSEDDPVTSSNAVCLNKNGLYDYNPDASGVDTETVDLGVTSYNGQGFYLFAKVYDEYAQACYNNPSSCSGDDYIAYSSTAYYSVYEDAVPTINSFTVSRPTGVTSFETLNVKFNISDLFDKYKYCLSDKEDPAECTSYSSFIEANGNDVTLTYNPTWARYDDPNVEESYFVFLHIIDSHDNYTFAFASTDRVPCTGVDEDDFGTIVSSSEIIVMDEFPKLTASVCENKCFWGVTGGGIEPKDIFSFYKKRISYVDKEDHLLSCGVEEEEAEEVHCNNKTCYEKGTGYHDAIGYLKHVNDGEAPFIHTHDGDTHTPDYYRNKYTVSYNSASGLITLHPTGDKICGTCFDNNISEYQNYVITYDGVFEE